MTCYFTTLSIQTTISVIIVFECKQTIKLSRKVMASMSHLWVSLMEFPFFTITGGILSLLVHTTCCRHGLVAHRFGAHQSTFLQTNRAVLGFFYETMLYLYVSSLIITNTQFRKAPLDNSTTPFLFAAHSLSLFYFLHVYHCQHYVLSTLRYL